MTLAIFPNESREYRAARDKLLADEIALRRQMEAVSEARRALPPGGAVAEDYVFETIGSDGAVERVRLSELFGDHDAILMDQMMFPRWPTDDRAPAASGETAALAPKDQPCPSCTALADQLDAAVPHFEAAGGDSTWSPKRGSRTWLPWRGIAAGRTSVCCRRQEAASSGTTSPRTRTASNCP